MSERPAFTWEDVDLLRGLIAGLREQAAAVHGIAGYSQERQDKLLEVERRVADLHERIAALLPPRET